MKTVSGSIILFILMFLAGCSDNALSDSKSKTKANLGELVTIKPGIETSFEDINGSRLHVKVLSIEDSRCPSDVVCVWEGMVVVLFQIGEMKALYTLCLGTATGCEKKTTLTYEGKQYTLELMDVKPYPSTTNGGKEKTVVYKLSD